MKRSKENPDKLKFKIALENCVLKSKIPRSSMEDYNSETENNNVDIKMEVDAPEYLNCKVENGVHSASPAVPSSSDPVQPVDGDKSDKEESESVKGSTNDPSVYFSVPTLTKRNVTLQMLLAAGILKPGEGTMSLEYHGQKFVGDLLESGQIKSQETSQTFSSPSAWAIACKQIINPEKIMRKSGCGWASIKYRSLKLDYYKTVWFKRVREGSIDIRNISNGATSSSDDSDDEGAPHCVVKYGEHYETSPSYQSAVLSGSKVLVSCSEFREMERLQPFHVKITTEALSLADFHCNISNTETVGYISGHWNGDQNILKLEVIHPCRVFMPYSSSIDCDNERNRIALEIQRLGHEVVGWYHSHPKAPAQPSKDDISRQLDYQVMMKGASESSYIPCIGLIISPLCFSNQEMKKSKVQLFWVMPPPENRPMEMGRPMHLEYDITSSSNYDTKKMLLLMESILIFYKEKTPLVDINDLASGRFDKLKETLSSWVPELKGNVEFWSEVKQIFTSPLPPPSLIPKLAPSALTGNSLELPVKVKTEDPDCPSNKAPNSVPSSSPTSSTIYPVPSTSFLPVSGPPSNSASTSRSVSTPSSTGDEPMTN